MIESEIEETITTYLDEKYQLEVPEFVDEPPPSFFLFKNDNFEVYLGEVEPNKQKIDFDFEIEESVDFLHFDPE